MDKWDIKFAYMQEVYKKLDRFGEKQDKETWLVKSNIDNKLYIWKEVEMEMINIYQKLKTVSSKNLASILELVRIDDKVVVIEEYISGDMLYELIQAGRVEEGMAVNVIMQLLEVLSVLHEQNIIHRDINPQNVLISTDGVTKLLDFGIARERKMGTGKDTTILGTAGYAAPEQFGFQQTDGRSDIYSLGVLFYMMLTKRLPDGNIQCQPKYQSFIKKCIALEPSQRYQSALEAYKDLENIINGEKTKSQDMENVVHEKKKAIDKIEKSNVNPYFPVGFRSNVLWKKILAGSFYVLMGIYILGMVIECAVTPLSFFLEFVALMLYIVLAFICITNYGDWLHKVLLLSKINSKWEMLIRLVLFCVVFTYGYELERYVRIVMLGFKA